MKYVKPYMQRPENVEWLRELRWEFDAGEYELAVARYRECYHTFTVKNNRERAE